MLVTLLVARWLNPTGAAQPVDTSLTVWIALPLFVAIFACAWPYTIRRHEAI
jgi:hypothetical protein